AVEGVTFETRGASAALVGDGSGLMRALVGNADVRSGVLALLGLDIARKEHLGPGTLGVAPLDPSLPPRWTARDYLVWGARLAGASAGSARESANATASDLGLGELMTRETSSLGLAERRAIVLAQAVVARPTVVVAAGPP